MDLLVSARQLMRSGYFGEAFKVLDGGTVPATQRVAAQVLQSEIFERIGRHSRGRTLADKLLRSNLSHTDRAACEYVIGRVCLEDGDTEQALSHLQRAASLAAEAKDLGRLCWTQIALLLVIADRFGYAVATPLLAAARDTAARAGDPQLMAALHVFVAEMEGKRGLIKSAQRHAKFARELLVSAPNVWLEAVTENIDFAASIIRADFESARLHGLRAYDLAQSSGMASTCCACLCNLGNLYQASGDFDRAVDYLERALAAFPSRSENIHVSLESLAQVRLLQNRADECWQLLERIDASVRSDDDHARYAHRYAELTSAQLLWRQGRLAEAYSRTDRVLELAKRVGDTLLYQMGLMTKAEICLGERRIDEALIVLRDALSYLPGESPELYAQYERILACASASRGTLTAARAHYNRAKRLCESSNSMPGIAELERIWLAALERSDCDQSGAEASVSESPVDSVVHGIAALMIHSRRFEFVAREIVSLLATTDSVDCAVALVRRAGGPAEILSSTGPALIDPAAISDRELCLSIGSVSDRRIEVVLRPKARVESSATINAIVVLLAALHDLERAREEREQRAALWPVEETAIQDERAVSTGHMREIVSLATRVAGTNVSVLITGESGTGKEVVARTIHASSDRAQKPFVPFNCTAVPREMLESQLFGHRRGAFTGADHDNPGVIRSARDGTLFLDEIGELGLDLQPKLLRFLESGEICPLGESIPFTVNVRVIAATNANLEALVKDGRFREDLFYRLNVIRLSIRPLRDRRDEIPGLIRHFVARAAEEFRRGQIRLADETVERLLLYPWPGNVRQLQNELRRMVAFAEPNSTLTAADISDDILSVTPVPAPVPAVKGREIAVQLTGRLMPTLSRIEREMIALALRDHHGKIDAAAKALGISRKGLYLKRQRLGL